MIATTPAQELIGAALAGEPEAPRRLAERLMPVVHAQVRASMFRSGGATLGANAEDLAQIVWLALLKDGGRQLRAYDPTRGASLETYVSLITRREISNRVRHERAERRGASRLDASVETADQPTTDGDPESWVVNNDVARRLDARLRDTLPARGLLIYRYLYEDGLTVAQIARALSVSHQVVYNWQHRIREVAREALAASDG